jgi:hypothetical protein
MKNILLMTLMTAAIIFMIAGCEQFSTTYQRIDDAEFRMLDFIFEPADASPGDIVVLTAVFAGKKADDLNKYIDWSISFNVVRDLLFGAATVIDSMPLEKVAIDKRIYANHPYWPNAQVVAFRIPIPKDIMRNSPQIPDRWTDILPPSVADAIPAEFASMTKNQIIDTLESFLENPNGVLDGSGLSAQNADYLPRLLQIFSVPIRVAAKINEPDRLPHAIHSYQTIRYNRSLAEKAGIRGIPVNYNPYIDSIVVYKVEGKNIQGDISGLKRTTTRLYQNCDGCDNVIAVEDGYTYFLRAFSDSGVDSSLTSSGGWTEEKHYAYWQYQLDSKEAGSVHHSDYMDIGITIGSSEFPRLTPPSDRRITKFTLWVTVKDEVLGELNRPEASALAEVSGRFEYK